MKIHAGSPREDQVKKNRSGTRGIWNNLDKNLSIFGRIQPDYCIRAIWIKKEEDGRILSTILSLPTLPEKLTEMCRPDRRSGNETR